MFDTMKTVAIYARVSTEEQAEEGYSIQAQLDTLRQYAKQNRYIVSKEYKDEGISGKSIQNRPQLQQLLRDAKQGLFQEVIVWKINRISRNQLDLLTIVDELQKHGVSFRSYTENFETETPMGRFALQMMGSVAELERNTIVDNVKMGMKQRARQGKWNGGKVLGYESVEVEDSTFRKRKETRLVIVEAEAALVRMIFEKYASGKGIKAIANELNHLGYKTKWGKPFSVVAVKDILNNPLYVGKIRFNKQENWTVKRRKGTNASPILADGEHEPIITEELWNTVQALYKSKSEKPAQVFHGCFPFTGVMRCPMCGHGMVAQRATRKNKNGEIKYTLYYQCGQFANKGSAVCRANSVRADYAEEEILARIEKIVSQPQITEDVVKELGQRQEVDKEPLEQELKHLDKELADTKRKMGKYMELYENDMLEVEILKVRLQELREQEQRLSVRKAKIENQLKSGDAAPIPFEVLKGMLREFRNVFKRADHKKRKQLVHSMIKEITVNSDRKIDNILWNFDGLVQRLLA
ncbi:recombinase family protein [Brevibacillus borstelensis]|uniref:recombinase family protein n=1 Tax=Brevibacillus borstelensis TaxID=45462 RepID=UPI002E1B77FB|nr:recombinase family protein [Brevibacillus borstelensis]MED1743199.1 recombinase family protein [Brevibacillus borstelensis]